MSKEGKRETEMGRRREEGKRIVCCINIKIIFAWCENLCKMKVRLIATRVSMSILVHLHRN